MIHQHCRPVSILVVTLFAMAVTGCNTVGPRAVRTSRVEYNDAILDSWNNQLLLNLVRSRYGEAPLFLELSSLTTQYSLETGLKIDPLWTRPDAETKVRSIGTGGYTRSRETGPGSGDEYAHGLTTNYYERPTATFAPMQGQDYVKCILSPVSIESIVLLTASGWGIDRVFPLCVQRLNDLPNAPGASGPTPMQAPQFREFKRAVELLEAMQNENRITAQVSDDSGVARLYVQFVGGPGSTDVEMTKLLGLPEGQSRFPMQSAWKGSDAGSIYIQTRSIIGIFNYLSNAVEVPQEHVDAGWVQRTVTADNRIFDWREVVGNLMCVRHSDARPEEAFVAVRYKGYWFYIPESDVVSKQTFALLSQLFYLQSGVSKDVAPLLTLPVGE